MSGIVQIPNEFLPPTAIFCICREKKGITGYRKKPYIMNYEGIETRASGPILNTDDGSVFFALIGITQRPDSPLIFETSLDELHNLLKPPTGKGISKDHIERSLRRLSEAKIQIIWPKFGTNCVMKGLISYTHLKENKINISFHDYVKMRLKGLSPITHSIFHSQ